MRNLLIWFGVAVLAIASILIFRWVQSGGFVCTPAEAKEADVKVIEAFDKVVDLGIKLSTTLAGLGAALLLGLKSGLRLTSFVRFFVFCGTILFAQSTFYAIWWRTGIAELWLNKCTSVVDSARLQYRFDAHFWLFVAGLVSLGLIVLGTLFAGEQPPHSRAIK